MKGGYKDKPKKKEVTSYMKFMKEAKKSSNYVQTKRAKKTPGRSVKEGGIEVIGGSKTQKPIPFRKGGLKESLGIGPNEKITAAELMEAVSGKAGEKAKKQALFYKNVLAKGQRTAAKNRKKT